MPLSIWRCSFILGVNFMLAMEAKATVIPYLNQSFLFNWTLPGRVVPVPVSTTPQCEPINITLSRTSAIGPKLVAPYYFDVYTSAFVVPSVFPAGPGLTYDWAVPFSPGTLYQVCMFDSEGNTGGCQAYTVIAPLSTPASCNNVTLPGALEVEAQDDNGSLSPYGWVDQCTDISILPKNGTPPYTLTIAPTSRLPYNITSNDMSSINWTVILPYDSQFFIGLFDSAGNVWSNGPIYSGGGDGGATPGCLSGAVASSDGHSGNITSSFVAIGAGVGGLVAGLLIGLAALLFMRRYYAKNAQAHRFVDLPSTHGTANAMTNTNLPQDFRYSSIPTMSISGRGVSHPGHTWSSSGGLPRLISGPLPYHVDPFVMPGENERLANEAASTGGVTTPPPCPPPASEPQQLNDLYHDSNIPSVILFRESGTEIVQLPPRYPRNTSPNDRSHTDARSDRSRTAASQPLRIHEPRLLKKKCNPTDSAK